MSALEQITSQLQTMDARWSEQFHSMDTSLTEHFQSVDERFQVLDAKLEQVNINVAASLRHLASEDEED
jgi:hypothetical protein